MAVISIRWVRLLLSGVSLLALLHLGASPVAWAQAPPPTPAAPPQQVDTVDVAVLENWPPYYTLDEEGNPSGFAVETLEAVFARAGLAPRYRIYRTFPDALEALTAGQVHLVPNLGIVDGRDVLYTTPLGAFSVGFFTRASVPGDRGPTEISGSIGVVEANIGTALLDEETTAADIVVFESIREALFRLIAGETDGLVYPSEVVWALARQAHVESRIKETRSGLAEVRRAIGVSPDRSDLVPRLDAAIAPFIASEEYARLQDEWFTPSPPYWTAQRVAGVAVAVLAVVLLALAGWRMAERARMNRELRHRERELRQLFESIRDAIVVADLDRTIVDMNPAALELFGYELDEVRGRKTAMLYARSEDFAEVGHELRVHVEEEGLYRTVEYRTRDGRVFPGETTAYYQRDEHGEPVGFIGLVRDITRRVEEERTATLLRRQLAEAQKMESLGRLAGGVAHDFNNILTIIQGNVELALPELGADDPVRDELLEIQEAASRSSRLTQQLLGFARRQPMRPEVLDPNDTVAGMLTMLRRLVTENIRLLWLPGDAPWPVRIDPGQVDQILANLVINARDAIDDGGTISIETRNITLDEPAAARFPDAHPGEYVEISVSDDGCGISEEILSSVFEPFFTTKQEGKGTGLGLALTYGIVQQNDGFVSVESEEGVGTTVRICLPRHAGEPGPERAEAPVAALESAGERILLVEDDSAVLGVTSRILKGLGYRIVAFQSPEEALRASEDGQLPFDLLITDVVMPEMDGLELASRIRAMAPDVPVLFVSGYSHDVIGQPGDTTADRHLLHKPFTPAELGRKVRQVLAG